MKTLHPLINEDSKHYEVDGKVAIQELEQDLSVNEMIGYCKGNIFKYEFRKERKGTLEADEKKIETYKDYLNALQDMSYFGLGNFKVAKAAEITKREWVYRSENLIDTEPTPRP